VAVDGTALTLTDWQRRKDFGAVWATNVGARGLRMINAYAVGVDGTPIGVLGQQWWKRERVKNAKIASIVPRKIWKHGTGATSFEMLITACILSAPVSCSNWIVKAIELLR